MSKKSDVIVIDGVSYRLEPVDSDVTVSTSNKRKYHQGSIKIPVGYSAAIDLFSDLLGLSEAKYIELAIIRRLKGIEPCCRIPEPKNGMWNGERESHHIRIPLDLYRKVKIAAVQNNLTLSEYICGAVFGWYGAIEEDE